MKKNTIKNAENLLEIIQDKKIEDEIVIKSQFIKSMISRLIRKAVQKNTNYAVRLKINEIGLVVTGRKVHIHIDADGVLNKNDFSKILKFIKAKVEIKSESIREFIAKKLAEVIKRKTGYEIGLKLNRIRIVVTKINAHIYLDADAAIDKTDLMKILDI